MQKNALVAQWIEHPPPKGRVTRSIRVEGTNRPGDINHLSYKRRRGGTTKFVPAVSSRRRLGLRGP